MPRLRQERKGDPARTDAPTSAATKVPPPPTRVSSRDAGFDTSDEDMPHGFGATTLPSRFILLLASVHWICYGVTMSLLYQALVGEAAHGQSTLYEVRRVVAIGLPTAAARSLIAPYLDGASAFSRWVVMGIAVTVCSASVFSLLSCNDDDGSPCGPIIGRELLSHEFVLGVLFAGQAIADLVVSTVAVSHPSAWFLHSPCISVGSAFATQLPHFTSESLGSTLVLMYLLQIAVMGVAGYFAYVEPAIKRELNRRPPRTQITRFILEQSGSMRTLVDYREVLRRTRHIIFRTPLMPWWALLALCAPAIYAPARHRLTPFQIAARSSMVAFVGKPLGNALGFFVARHYIIRKKHVWVLVAGYCAAAGITILFPAVTVHTNAEETTAVYSFLWLVLDSLQMVFDTAEGYVYFALAAHLGGGLCATVLIAMQDVLYSVGEMFFVSVTMFTADVFSLGCEADLNGIRSCVYDAFPWSARFVCTFAIGALLVMYWEGTLAQCFDVHQDKGWSDAGRVLQRSLHVFRGILLVCFLSTAFCISVLLKASPDIPDDHGGLLRPSAEL
jgi:hypothetical protein